MCSCRYLDYSVYHTCIYTGEFSCYKNSRLGIEIGIGEMKFSPKCVYVTYMSTAYKFNFRKNAKISIQRCMCNVIAEF